MSISERKLKNGKKVYDNCIMIKGHRYKKGGFYTKGEAKAWESMVRAEIAKKGTHYAPCNLTLREVWLEYYQLGKKGWKYNTIKSLEAAYNTLKQSPVMDKPITEIRYTDLQKALDGLADRYAPRTLVILRGVFSRAFNHAIMSGYTENNPTPYVKIRGGKKPPETSKALTEEQIRELIKAFENLSKCYTIPIYLCLYTGARITEALALTWEDVDFDNATIDINKHQIQTSHGLKNDTPKTQKSDAIVPMPDILVRILKDWRNENRAEYVCLNMHGQVLSYATLKHALSYLNLSYHFKPHQLRHTYASRLILAGVDPVTVRELMRHTDIHMTLGTYSHTNAEAKKRAIDKVFTHNLHNS